jgi:ATP-dependent protease ClpP protease subunit
MRALRESVRRALDEPCFKRHPIMIYRLVFNGELYQAQTNALRHRIATILELRDCESLTVVFSSQGGNTDEGIALYNFIRSLQRNVDMHAVGHVGSMAIPVFLAGTKRTCTPYSRFFFHAYDWGFDGRQMSDRIAEALQRLDSDINISRDIVAKHTTIPAEKLSTLYGRAPQPTIFRPEEAKEVGIVEGIVELNPTGENQPNVAVWTVAW